MTKIRFTFLRRIPVFGVAVLTSLMCASVAGARPRVLPSSPAVPVASSPRIATTLEQSTGLSPSQVAVSDTCPAARPGYAQCAAETLVLRSSHRPVRPHAHASRTFTQVRPAGRHDAGSAAAGPASATSAASTVSPPQAGTPAWLQQAYDLSALSQTAGVGKTIAVVDAYDDPTAESDLATYRSTFGLPACTTANGCFEKVNENGATRRFPAVDTDWEQEESLDLDAVSALCPNCHIILVEARSDLSTDLAAANQTAGAMGANAISNSFTVELGSVPAQTFTVAGVPVLAATGDHGYLGPGSDDYPAALPGVTAVGGTSLANGTDGGARGFTETAWSLSSDDWGAGSGCDTLEAKPSWQTDTGCAGRAYADVSADADPDTGMLVSTSAVPGGWEMFGGTSLATPLTAAYEAVTGTLGADTSARWAYTDHSLLNDPSSGSSGACDASISYICDARVGYDGPTGAGSINGTVAQGAPGVAAAPAASPTGYVTATTGSSVTLAGGVYPNDLATSYYWQYGPTAALGQQTQAVSLPAGRALARVTGTLSGLSSDTSYHYRLVAVNSAGTTYGYTYTADTSDAAAAPPTTGTVPPVITTQPTQAAPVQPAPTPVAPTPAPAQPTPPPAQSTPAPASSPVKPTPGPAQPARTIKAPSIRGRAAVGATLTATPGTPGKDVVVQLMKCTTRCVRVGRAGARRYTLKDGDAGAVFVVRETVRGSRRTLWSRPVGPVVSKTVAVAVAGKHAAALRATNHRLLATASINARRSVITVRRAAHVKGTLTAWVCAAPAPGDAPGPCTRTLRLRARATIKLRRTTRVVRVVVRG